MRLYHASTPVVDCPVIVKTGYYLPPLDASGAGIANAGAESAPDERLNDFVRLKRESDAVLRGLEDNERTFKRLVKSLGYDDDMPIASIGLETGGGWSEGDSLNFLAKRFPGLVTSAMASMTVREFRKRIRRAIKLMEEARATAADASVFDAKAKRLGRPVAEHVELLKAWQGKEPTFEEQAPTARELWDVLALESELLGKKRHRAWHYTQAIHDLSTGNYVEAIRLFDKLKGYKDADSFRELAQDALRAQEQEREAWMEALADAVRGERLSSAESLIECCPNPDLFDLDAMRADLRALWEARVGIAENTEHHARTKEIIALKETELRCQRELQKVEQPEDETLAQEIREREKITAELAEAGKLQFFMKKALQIRVGQLDTSIENRERALREEEEARQTELATRIEELEFQLAQERQNLAAAEIHAPRLRDDFQAAKAHLLGCISPSSPRKDTVQGGLLEQGEEAATEQSGEAR